MKKALSILITSIMAISLFSGCSDNKDKKTGNSTKNSNQTTSTIDAEKLTPTISTEYQWKNVSIGGGGFVSGVIYNQGQKNVLYARTDVGTMYRWDFSKKEWIPLMDFIGAEKANDTGVLSVATDPTDPNRVYSLNGLYSGNGSIYASKDSGNTWTSIDSPFRIGGNDNGRNAGERLLVDPNLPSSLFAGSTASGLWKSEDYAASWKKVDSFKASYVTFVNVDPASSKSGEATKTIFAGTNEIANSMYISKDGGNTWNTIPGQPTGMVPLRSAVSNGILYVTYGTFDDVTQPGPNGATSGAIYKYEIEKGVWTNITPKTTQGGFSGISVDKQNPNVLIASTLDCWWPQDEVFRSIDGGKTWSSILTSGQIDISKAPYAKDSKPHWIADIQINPFDSNNALFVTGYGIFMTDNLTDADKGNQIKWSFENVGLEETVVLDLASPTSGAELFSAVGDVTGFKHDNVDVSPAKRHNPPYGNSFSVDYAGKAPNIVVRLHTANNGTTHGSYSKDGGDTWTAFATEPANAGDNGTIAVSADGKNILWALAGQGMFYSADFGNTWTPSKGGSSVSKPVSDKVNPNNFYIYAPGSGYVYTSVDGGKTFELTDVKMPPVSDASKTQLRSVFDKEGDLWIAADGCGLYHSTASGKNFKRVNTIDEAYNVSFGKAAPSSDYPAIYVIGKLKGIYGFYRSDDKGATWVRINDDKHQFGQINAMTADPKVYGRIYLGTGGRGVIYGDMVE